MPHSPHQLTLPNIRHSWTDNGAQRPAPAPVVVGDIKHASQVLYTCTAASASLQSNLVRKRGHRAARAKVRITAHVRLSHIEPLHTITFREHTSAAATQ